ncbi:MAG TPA: hypothetical protein VN256_13060 [Pyrinomonadaceae bacterium]|nr:hypothetical protein [Pyrinomonadaceae bacterium]
MRKSIRLTILILVIVFGTAGFTAPGCEQKQDIKKLVAVLVSKATPLAFNELADLFDAQLNKLEEKFDKVNLPDEVKTHYRGFIGSFRGLSGEVRLVRSKADFDKAAGKFKGLYRDVRCHLRILEGEFKEQLSGLFDGVGELVEPLKVEVEDVPVEIGGDRLPVNRDDSLCP